MISRLSLQNCLSYLLWANVERAHLGGHGREQSSAASGGGQDAYFMVRDASPSDPDSIEEQARLWLHRLHDLASGSSLHINHPLPFDKPSVRVLEGLPPKQLKSDEEVIPLLRWLKRDAGQVTQLLAGDCVIHELFSRSLLLHRLRCDAKRLCALADVSIRHTT